MRCSGNRFWAWDSAIAYFKKQLRLSQLNDRKIIAITKGVHTKLTLFLFSKISPAFNL